MEITSGRIALLNSLPFKYLRNSEGKLEVIKSIIMFGDSIEILREDVTSLPITREYRNEEWFILEVNDKYIIRLPEDMRVICYFLKPLTPQLLARRRLAGMQ